MRNKAAALLLFCAAALYGCGGIVSDRRHASGIRPDMLEQKLNTLTINGEWDSLFRITYPLVLGDVHDTAAMVCAALYNAQYYLYRENLDSVLFYQSIAAGNLSSIEGTRLEGMYYAQEGMYQMKSKWDFPTMVAMLLRSYDVYKELGEVSDMVYALTNIVNFYYMRSDVRGLEYAEEAWSLVNGHRLSVYYQGVVSITMAEMLSLSKSPLDALPYLRTADSVVRNRGLEPYYSIVDLLKADIALVVGDSTAADSLYMEALGRETVTEPVVVSLACLHYGRFCEDRGMNARAAELYGKGLSISERYANLELRNELLRHLADVNYALGDWKGALEHYRLSIAGQAGSREWELNDLRMSYQQIVHDKEMQLKELDLMRTRRLIVVAVSVLVVVAVISVSFIVLFRRQRRVNRTLVDQYRAWMQRTPQRLRVDDADRNLWEKVDRMMSEDRLYLRKDLTLESMAQAAGTNRTYLSKAINTFSGGNFSSYVDRYRIREAVGIIETKGSAVDLREVGDMVGYSSVPAFYKAFSKETGLPPGRYRDEIIRRR